MTKTIATVAATAALVLAMATPAFAAVNVTNHGTVTNHVHTNASSGDNNISGFFVAGGSIQTGDASSNALVVNNVNSSNVNAGHHSVTVTNTANVTNGVHTNSSTGGNNVSGAVVLGGSISTGNAGAGSGVVNVVNTTVSH